MPAWSRVSIGPGCSAAHTGSIRPFPLGMVLNLARVAACLIPTIYYQRKQREDRGAVTIGHGPLVP
jgi:hypothetical protein